MTGPGPGPDPGRDPSPTPVDLTASQRAVRDEVGELCAEFDAAYWRERDAAGEYPHEFVDRLGEAGWIGVLLPEAYGGKGLGTPEAVAMLHEVARSGAGFSGAQTVHAAVYNSRPLVRYGSEALKADLLPGVASGETSIQCFGLTEPGAGSESTAIETRAVRDGDEYRISGRKIWTSRLDVSDYMVLVARTTPRDAVETHTRGISLFLVDLHEALDAGGMRVEEIDKTASNVVHSFRVEFDDLVVPADRLIGEEGRGFSHVLDGLNEERLVIAAECVGLGELAIERGAEYAAEREVFGRPIGQNQAIQHPLAAAAARVGAAKVLTYTAAREAERAAPKTVGAWANTAKYLAAEACFEAADAAVQTHGGFGVAREYDVERYLREARLTRLVPITQELALSYLAEHALDLPRSY